MTRSGVALGAPIAVDGGADDVSDVLISRSPAEFALREAGVRDEHRGIARSPLRKMETDSSPGCRAHGLEHFENGSAAADAKICAERAAPAAESIDRADVRIR
jgi:hypothetical protein